METHSHALLCLKYVPVINDVYLQVRLDSESAAEVVFTLQQNAIHLKQSLKFAKFLNELINRNSEVVSGHICMARTCTFAFEGLIIMEVILL